MGASFRLHTWVHGNLYQVPEENPLKLTVRFR